MTGGSTSAHRVVNPWTWQDRAGFVQAVEVVTGETRTLYCAGLVSVDDDGTSLHPGDVLAQANRALDNLQTLLGTAGYELTDLVRVTTYATDVAEYQRAAAPAVRERLFGSGCRFAATLVGVAALARPDLLIEIEATAVR